MLTTANIYSDNSVVTNTYSTSCKNLLCAFFFIIILLHHFICYYLLPTKYQQKLQYKWALSCLSHKMRHKEQKKKKNITYQAKVLKRPKLHLQFYMQSIYYYRNRMHINICILYANKLKLHTDTQLHLLHAALVFELIQPHALNVDFWSHVI